MQLLEMLEHLPEQCLGHLRIALPVGVRQSVLAGRGGAANGRERTGVQAQRVAGVVETEGVSQLCIEQTHDMAPRFEGAGSFFDAGVTGQLGDQMAGNKIAELAQETETAARWLVSGFLFHSCLVAGPKPATQLFLPHENLKPVGRL